MTRVPIARFATINPRAPKSADESQQISFLSMASVSEDGKVTKQETRTFRETKKGFTYFERGDVLLAKITPCFENGKAANTDSLQHRVGFGSTEFHVLRAIPGMADANYLFHLVRSSRFRFLGQKSMQGAAGHKRVPAAFIENYEAPAWPINDQLRIAHLLGKVEGLIAERKQCLQQLDDLLKSVFLEMFGDPILNPRGLPVRRLSEFYVNPKEGTKCGPFGSALKKEELVQSGVPVWNMDNIGPGGQMVLPFRMWITTDKYDDLAAYSVQDGDIVISRAGTVGKMCVVRMNGQPAIISTNLIRLRLDSALRPLHFVSLMLYCKGRVGRLKTGADGAFTHMNTGVLDSLEFPYPPIELQDQFAEIATKVESTKARYQQSLTDLQALYGALSQQAFKGELDLSRVPLSSIKPEEEKAVVTPPLHARAEESLAITLPDISVLLDAVQGPMRQQDIWKCWLDAYREQLGGAPFLLQKLMAAAETRAGKWNLDGEYEIGVEDYEHIKTWVFEALADGRLQQSRDITEYDENGNPIFGNLIEIKSGARP